MRVYQNVAVCNLKVLSSKLDHASTLISDFQPPGLWATPVLYELPGVWCSDVCVCHVQLFGTPWTTTHQAPLFMGLSRQEYWSRLPFPSSGDLPNPGFEPWSPALQADSLSSEPPMHYIFFIHSSVDGHLGFFRYVKSACSLCVNP